MQATGTLRETRVSRDFVLVVIAMLCALVLGAAGGYAARSGGSATVRQTQAQPRVDAVQGDPRSDLTRALPTAAPANPAAGYDIGQWTGSNQGQPDHGFIP